jgi:hypothetical protein
MAEFDAELSDKQFNDAVHNLVQKLNSFNISGMNYFKREIWG